jgi:hypothetical protein
MTLNNSSKGEVGSRQGAKNSIPELQLKSGLIESNATFSKIYGPAHTANKRSPRSSNDLAT